jgi:hypothetical protein
VFRKFGHIYLPSSISGTALCLWTGFIAEQTFVMVDRHSHSVSDTLLGTVPIIGTMLLLLWLLAAKSALRH